MVGFGGLFVEYLEDQVVLCGNSLHQDLAYSIGHSDETDLSFILGIGQCKGLEDRPKAIPELFPPIVCLEDL